MDCPKQDVITYFDNIGKYVVKSYRVSTEKTSQADIITATLHIKLGSDLQCKENLKPSNWTILSEAAKQEKMKMVIEESNTHFRKIRLKYIETVLDIVKFENDDVEALINSFKTGCAVMKAVEKITSTRKESAMFVHQKLNVNEEICFDSRHQRTGH